MLLNDKIDEFIQVKFSGTLNKRRKPARRWGNLFLTQSWKLLIDMRDEPHEFTLQRFGISEWEMNVSGRWEAFPLCMTSRPLRTVFRSSPGVDSGRITEEEYQMIVKAVDRVAIAHLSKIPLLRIQ